MAAFPAVVRPGTLLAVRIFLSYAAERRKLAESIAQNLRGRSFKVFLDRTDLPAGQTYDRRIEQEIARADLFVFLLSPESVASGSYARSELELASRKWPDPHGRVLPVLVAPTRPEEVPAYLEAVTFSRPQGNVAVEVAVDVEAMCAKFRTRRTGLALLATLAAGGLLAWALLGREEVRVRALGLRRVDPELFEENARYQLELEFTNRSSQVTVLDQIRIETLPASVLREADADFLSLAPFPAAERWTRTWVAREPGLAPEKARVCWLDSAGRPRSGPWFDWRSTDAYREEPAPPERVRAHAHGVASDGQRLIVLSTNPVCLTSCVGGVWGEPAPVQGAPAEPAHASLGTSDGGTLLVACGGPSYLAVVVPDAPLRITPVSLEEFRGFRDDMDAPISCEIRLALESGDERWILSEPESGAAALFHASRGHAGFGAFELVPYQDEVSFDLRDMALRIVDGTLWGTPQNTTPTSLYRFDPRGWQVWSGNDVNLLSCATDVARHPDGLLILDCEDRVVAVRPVEGGSLERLGELGKLPAWPSTTSTWETHELAVFDDGVVVALNQEEGRGDSRASRSRIVLLRGTAQILYETEAALVAELAIAGKLLAVLFVSPQGQRDLRVFRLP
jgi:TIR domain-containing protein